MTAPSGIVVGASAFAGLLLGSFANVVVHRVPRGGSLLQPPSACPSCGAHIRPRDNVPLLSWLLLRGRCRDCSAPIPARYLLLEAGVAGVFALTALSADRVTDLILLLPVAFLITCLAIIDLEHRRLPDALTLPAIGGAVVLAAVAAALGPGWDAFVRALLAGAIALAVFFAIALISPGGFGLGDVKLAPTLGIAMGYLPRGGPRAFVGFLAAFVLGTLVGLVLIVIGRGNRKTMVPFGPFLVLGTFLAWWIGAPLVRAWLG